MKNIILTGENEIVLGLIKLLLIERKIKFKYDSKGYRVEFKDFLKVKEQVFNLSGQVEEVLNENTFS